MSKRDKVYLLGAGASCASVGLPLGSELVWLYEAHCGLARPMGTGGPIIDGENARFARFREFLDLAVRVFPELSAEIPIFEKRGIYTYWPNSRLSKRHYVDEMMKALIQENDVHGLDLVRQLISEHLNCRTIHSQNALYEAFVSNVLGPEKGRASVILLNYDYALHEDFHRGVYFDYVLDFQWIDEHRASFYKREAPIPLLKLHGSLDWGLCESCGSKHLYYFHLNKDFYLSSACKMCGGKVVPLITLPRQGSSGMEALWSSAERALADCANLVVIGYSLPPYDTDMLDLLRRSLSPSCHITVVDFCPPGPARDAEAAHLAERTGAFLARHPASVDICLDGFDGYLRSRGVAVTGQDSHP